MAVRCCLLHQRPSSSFMSRFLPAIRAGKLVPSSSYNIRLHSSQAICSAPTGVTGRVCNWINSVQLSDVPPDVQTKVKHLVLDGIACAIVGAKLPWSRVAVQAILDIEGPGKCTVFGWDKVRATLPFSLRLKYLNACWCLLLRTASVVYKSAQRCPLERVLHPRIRAG